MVRRKQKLGAFLVSVLWLLFAIGLTAMPVSAVDAGSEPQKVQLGGDIVANGDTEHEAVAKTPIVKAEDKKVENKVVTAKKVVVNTVIPKTGDNNNIVLWAIILVAALATVIVVKKVYTNKR